MSLFQLARLIYRNGQSISIVTLTLVISTVIFTHNQPREYAVSSLIYTGIASGFNLESGSSDKIDYHAVNNAFDNLISIIQSRETQREVLIQLLSLHISRLANGGNSLVPLDHQEKLNLHLGNPAQYYQYSKDSSFTNLHQLYKSGDDGITSLINSEIGPYSLSSLNSLEVKRHKSSDMLILYYRSNSPFTSKETLEILIEVFTKRFKVIKESETGDVVAYFEAQLAIAKDKLNKAEDKLTLFRSGKRVINYSEQTKAIAIKKQNALDEYSKRKMNLQATKIAVEKIEERLEIRETLLAKNVELIDKKNKLTFLTQKLAHLQHDPNSNNGAAFISSQIDTLKIEIQKDLELVFNYSNTKEGLPSKQLLNQWLENIISLNREKANVSYYKERLDELDRLYDKFAPLGSTLARLEREIDVCEREYLEILNGLNMSKLRQQNLQMANKIEVVDWPQTPIQPIKSKRSLLVVIAFLTGIFGMISIYVTLELLDTSLKNPSKAESITGLTIAGAFPKVNTNMLKSYPDIANMLTNHLVDKIGLAKKPQLILVVSTFKNEGKSFVATKIAETVERLGYNYQYIQMLTSNQLSNDWSPVDYNIIEVPALAGNIINEQLFKTADQIVYVVRADRTWTLTQARLKQRIESITLAKQHMVLNGVKTYYLEELLGDIKAKRSPLIKKIRHLMKFEFNNSFNLF
ncbi:MAG: hypothetical protein JXQ90_07450 [Cyclobacteriaceae bacterium]